jgi:hypothetical protein
MSMEHMVEEVAYLMMAGKQRKRKRRGWAVSISSSRGHL